MGIEKIFKPYILNSGGYKGGPEAVQKAGHKIYKLSSNENYFGTSPQVEIAVTDSVNNLNIYTAGTPDVLYKALEEYSKGSLSQDQFIAGNSGSGLIQVINNALLDNDSNIIINRPCFAPYTMFAEWAGASVIDVPLIASDYSLDVKGILGSITPNTRLIYLTSPNNPTGTYIRKDQIESLIEGIPDHVIIVLDEVYHHFANAQDYTTALPFVQQGLPVIGLNSFSKAFGLAALRIGYAYSTPRIIAYLRKLIRPFIINKLGLSAAIAALQDEVFLNSSVSKIQEQRKRLLTGLSKIPNIQTWPSQGNFVLVKTHLDEIKLTQLLKEKDIMVRPARNFGAPGCVRISIGDAEATGKTLGALTTILS